MRASPTRLSATVLIAPVLVLAGCAVAPPSGPQVMALPAQGKSFEVFQQEDANCRGYASQQSGGAQATANAGNNAVGSAVLGTAIGAAAGAALGSLGGQVGTGAAVGATAGALVGGAAGASQAQAVGATAQQRYDVAYTQCMYAHGNTVQSPPGGYVAPYYGYAGYPYPYGYAYPGYYGPGVGIGFSYGWRGGYRYWH